MKTLLRLALLAGLSIGCAADGLAGELDGKPIKVNPPSDAAGSVLSASLAADRKGGFGVVWGKDTDGSPGQDALFARFYDKKGKAAGKAIRYDAKIAGKTTRAVFFGRPLLLGDGAIFQPWNAQFTDDTASPLLAQLFKKQKAAGKYRTFSTDDGYTRAATQLRDGRGILTLPGQSSGKPVGQFVEEDGSPGAVIPFSETEFFGTPQSLQTGFIRYRIEPGPATSTYYLYAKTYDAQGNELGAPFRLTQDFTLAEFGPVGAVGLETGDLFVYRCVLLPEAGRCRMMAQLFTKAGAPVGQPKVLFPNVSRYLRATTHLPDGGFELIIREDVSSGAKMQYYRFDAKMKPKGVVTEKRPGGDREDLDPVLMTDGRILAGYLLDRKTIVAQVVKP